VRRVFSHADTVFIDLKLCDPQRHKKATGVDNSLILGNIRLAAQENTNLILRMPVIPAINDDEDNIRQSAGFILGLARPVPLELLAYHEFAKSKYLGLDKKYEPELLNIAPPLKEHMEQIACLFRRHGVTIIST
jgi:pyruvate formate lyase activating enzyme